MSICSPNKFLVSVLLAFVLFGIGMTNYVFAEQVIEASGSYVMDISLNETPAVAQGRARERATRDAAQKAGVYVESFTKVVNLIVQHDEINAVTAQLLKIQNETCKVTTVNDNLLKFTVYLTAIVEDTDAEKLKAMLNDRMSLDEVVRRNKELQKEYDALKQEMDALKNSYNTADSAERIAITKQIANNDNAFAAVQAIEEGNQYYAKRQYQKALAAYNRAEKLNLRSAEMYNSRGLVYYHLHEYANAIADFNDAIAIDGNFFYAYNNRGIVKHDMLQIDEAIDDYTKALRINPKFAYALNNRANSYTERKDVQNALVDLEKAVQIYPNYADAHNNLGNVYVISKRYDEAINEYTAALSLQPNDATAYYNRANCYYRKGDRYRALQDAKRAVELAPTDAEISTLYKKLNRT